MTTLVVVTGVSCAGKTTLGQQLADIDQVTRWLDVDHAAERPVTAWRDWLAWRAATELHTSAELAGPDDPTWHVLSGIVWPFRLIESPAWAEAVDNPYLSVHWLLLDPPWRVLRERLDARTAAEPERERRRLRRYNRELRATLRYQVDALRNSTVARTQPAIDRVLELIGAPCLTP